MVTNPPRFPTLTADRKLLNFLASIALLLFSLNVYADDVEVTILGSGTPIPSIERFGPSTLIEYKGKKYLFDVGRGTTIRLNQIGINAAEIDYLFLTHLHSDHITGFADLWLTGWIWQRRNDLNVYGPEGIEGFITYTQKAFSSDIAFRRKQTGLSPDGLKLNLMPVQQGVIYKDNDVRITAIRVEHGAVENAYGYRFDTDKHSVLLSGDTTFSKNLIHHGKDVDLLIHELAVIEPRLIEHNNKLKKISDYHTSLQQAKKVIDHIQPDRTVFNHLLIIGVEPRKLSQDINTLFKGRAELAYDLMKIVL